ncbi:MAG: Rpn family recombination-promoting nuclease/putative transposase [Treponema sp.]
MYHTVYTPADMPMAFTVRNDYAFKQVFGTESNKDILIAFVSLVIGMPEADFSEVKLENTELAAYFYDEKTGRLDIKLRLKNGEKINVEMQNIWFDDFSKRSIFYWTQLLTEDFTKGSNYGELNKCIMINLVNQPFPCSNKLHSVYKILETDEHTELDNILEIHFLDLTKINREKQSVLEKWLLFIQTDDEEVRKMLAQDNPLLKKANETMERFYTVAEQRALYQAAMKYECDRVSMLNAALKKGRAEGVAFGKRQAHLDTARALKQLNVSSEKIMKATGLTQKDIDDL